MPIDPRLYHKYSGKMPGEAMSRLGESLAESVAKKSRESSRGPSSFMMTWWKWRLWMSVAGALGTLIVLMFRAM